MRNKKGIGLITLIIIIAVILVIVFAIVMLIGKDDVTNNEIGNVNNGSQINENNNVGNNNEIENSNNNNNSNNSNDNGQEDSNFHKTWGRTDSITTDDGVNIDRFKINVPKYLGSYYYGAKISEHLDNTVVFISGQYLGTPSVENISEIFLSYLQYTKESLKDLYGIQSSNFNITIDSSKSITIGNYDMYTHTGIITYDYDNNKRTHQYVAYATQLKDSKHSAYWMVYDISDNQSNGKLIAEHALNMAKTFREE